MWPHQPTAKIKPKPVFHKVKKDDEYREVDFYFTWGQRGGSLPDGRSTPRVPFFVKTSIAPGHPEYVEGKGLRLEADWTGYVDLSEVRMNKKVLHICVDRPSSFQKKENNQPSKKKPKIEGQD